MREAFVYMFKDNCFGKKAILYFTLSFIASVCSAYALMHSCTGACPITAGNGIFIPNKTNTVIYQMLGSLFHLLILGYFNICINAITKQVNNIVLPFFNFTSSLLKGLKYFLAILFPVVSFALITGILQEINILAANLFLTIILFFYLIFSIAFFWLLANENKFLTFFSYKKAIKKVLEAPAKYFKSIIFISLICVLTFIINFIIGFIFALFNLSLLTTMLSANLVASIVSTYTAFVSMFLIAKSINP